MNYLNTKWIKQQYPTSKKYYWWKCDKIPNVDLYTDKAIQRGVIKEAKFLYKVVVTEWGKGLKIVGIYPKQETSGANVQKWLNKTRQGNIGINDFEWADNLKYPY